MELAPPTDDDEEVEGSSISANMSTGSTGKVKDIVKITERQKYKANIALGVHADYLLSVTL